VAKRRRLSKSASTPPQSSRTPPAPPPPVDPARPHADEPRPAAPRPDWWYLHLWQIQPIRDVLLIAAVVLLIQFGYALRIVTIPILVAMLLAYLFEPLVEKVTKRRWVSRPGATLLIIFTAAILVVVPLTVGLGFAAVQGTQLARSLSTNIALVNQASESYQNDAKVQEIKARLPNDGWRTIADYVVELRADAARLDDPALLADPARPPSPDESTNAAPAPTNPSAVRDWWQLFPPKPTSSIPIVSPRPAFAAQADAADVTAAELRAQRLRDAKTAEFEVVRMVSEWIQTHTSEIGQQALVTGRGAVGIALGTASSVGVFLFQGFLTAFFFYFFSTGWGKVQEFWESLIPERKKGVVVDMLRKMDAVIAGFVRGRLLIGVILSLYFTLAYWLIGVPAPLLLGPITGLLCLVPYLGIITVPIAIISMWLAPSPWFSFQTSAWWMILAPIVVYNLGQFVDDYFLTPSIQGKSTDMDVPSILFATIAGGALAGIYGLLLAIPVAACVKILLREVFWPKFRRWATGQEKDFLPIDRM